MGCWAETDSITQLPINYEDKVRVFVLLSQKSYKDDIGTIYYNNDLWAPLGLPVQGTYDDYGNIENIVENQDTELLLNRIKEVWIPFKDKYEKVPSIKNMKLSEALYFIERGRVKAKSSFNQHFGIMFVLEGIYQTMISFDPIETHYNYVNQTYIYKPNSEILKSNFKMWYLKSLNIMKDSSYSEEDKLKNIMLDLMCGDLIFFDFKEYGIKQYKNILIKLIKKSIPFEDEKVQSLLNSVIEILKFNKSMTSARKMYSPQSGKGRQDNDLTIYKALNKAVSNIIEENDKKYDNLNEFECADANGYYPYMIAHNLENKE